MSSERRTPQVRPAPGGEKPDPTSARRDDEPLGKLLVESGAVKREQLEQALIQQRKTFLPLGRILRDEHGLATAALAAALRRQNYCPRVFLRFFPVETATAALLPAKFCRQFEVIAIEQLDKLLCIALSRARRGEVLKHVETVTNLEVKVFQAPAEDILRKLSLLGR
jgi:hypothetical protein